MQSSSMTPEFDCIARGDLIGLKNIYAATPHKQYTRDALAFASERGQEEIVNWFYENYGRCFGPREADPAAIHGKANVVDIHLHNGVSFSSKAYDVAKQKYATIAEKINAHGYHVVDDAYNPLYFVMNGEIVDSWK